MWCWFGSAAKLSQTTMILKVILLWLTDFFLFPFQVQMTNRSQTIQSKTISVRKCGTGHDFSGNWLGCKSSCYMPECWLEGRGWKERGICGISWKVISDHAWRGVKRSGFYVDFKDTKKNLQVLVQRLNGFIRFVCWFAFFLNLSA